MMEVVSPVEEPEPVAGVLDIEQLYRAEARRLTAMLCAFLGDRGEAEDVTQEAFLRVQRSWHRIDDPAKAPAYLRATAFNVARSGLRRRRRRPDPPWSGGSVENEPRVRHLAGPDSTEDGLSLREDQREVLAALVALPERQRACVVLRFYGGDSIDEIARVLGISVNSVKTHLRRAMARLEEQLEPLR